MKIVDSFIIGGVAGHPSMPGKELQRAIGGAIRVNMMEHELYVPTSQGVKIARPGDAVVAYEGGTFDVAHKGDELWAAL